MLNITNQALKTAISGYDLTAAAFITLVFPTTSGAFAKPAGDPPATLAERTFRITEAPRDTVVGSLTFNSSNELVGLSAPNTQNAVDRDNYSMSFADNNAAIRNRFTTVSGGALTGVPLTVQLGFFDDNGVLISELLNVYTGQSSSVLWSKKGDGFVCQVAFTGQLTQLESSNAYLTSPTSQHQITARSLNASLWSSTVVYAVGDYVEYAQVVYRCILIPPVGTEPAFTSTYWKAQVDTSMDLIHEGVNDDAIKWGKKS